MNKTLIRALALVSIIWNVCLPNVTSAKEQIEKPYYRQFNFAMSLLKDLQNFEPQESIFYSPYSVYQTLLMAYFAAGGETESELKKVLGFKSTESKADIENLYKLKTAQTHRFENESIEFTSANKIYVSTEMKIRDSIKKLLGTDIEPLNFAENSDQSIQHINEFVAKATKDNIRDFITNELDNNTKFAMVNAVYFKGQWASIFQKNQTVSKLFYKQNGEAVYVDMMSKRGPYESGYINSLDTKVLKIPFKSENESISMFIFLPSHTTFDKLITNLTPEMLDDIFSEVSDRIYFKTLQVFFPKFSIEKKSDITSVMKNLEIHSLFENANLTGLFESTSELFEAELTHKAKIEIDEEGSTSYAATGYFHKLAWVSPGQFDCNAPFLFLIHDQQFNEILFAGIYHGPENQMDSQILANVPNHKGVQLNDYAHSTCPSCAGSLWFQALFVAFLYFTGDILVLH